jgi:hypothetical protein
MLQLKLPKTNIDEATRPLAKPTWVVSAFLTCSEVQPSTPRKRRSSPRALGILQVHPIKLVQHLLDLTLGKSGVGGDY